MAATLVDSNLLWGIGGMIVSRLGYRTFESPETYVLNVFSVYIAVALVNSTLSWGGGLLDFQ